MESTICPDLMRMDDDGAPPVILPIRQPEPEPVILPFRIGIAPPAPVAEFRATPVAKPEPEVITFSGPMLGKTVDGQHRAAADLATMGEGEVPPSAPVILNAQGEPADEISWPKYLAWRKTKCRPYDYVNGPKNISLNDIYGTPDYPKVRALEEIDQAIHEFVGEVAELGELIVEQGPNIFYGGRAKLIDEIGDILFCGAWVMDAWGKNPLSDLKEGDSVELIDMDKAEYLSALSHGVKDHSLEEIMEHEVFMDALSNQTSSLYIAASVQAGLLCNSFKKLRFQRREQDVAQQVARVFGVFMVVAQILGIANAGIEDAMRANMRKLNARFPEGYKPGVGGGIRTREGK